MTASGAGGDVSAHGQRSVLFKRAVRWLYEQAGDDAVLEAFGDPEPINEAWELDLESFKEYLRGRCRAAIETARRRVA